MKMNDVCRFDVTHNLKDEAENVFVRFHVIESISFDRQISKNRRNEFLELF